MRWQQVNRKTWYDFYLNEAKLFYYYSEFTLSDQKHLHRKYLDAYNFYLKKNLEC